MIIIWYHIIKININHYKNKKDEVSIMANINEIIKSIKEYQSLQDQVKAEIDKLKAEAIDYLTEHDIDEYTSDEGKVTYREVISNRFDTTAFKKDFADVYAEYTKRTHSMRFTCN